MNKKSIKRRLAILLSHMFRKWPSLHHEVLNQLVVDNYDVPDFQAKVNAEIYHLVATGSPWLRNMVMQHEAYAASFVRQMAITGQATDECLKQDVLPMSVGYYFPIPDIRDLDTRQFWERKSELTGIPFDPEIQLRFLDNIGQEYGDECNWPPDATSDPYQFFTENNSFSFGCAAVLHCMIRYLKPKRIFEIGSGNSSLIISKAISLNNTAESDHACEEYRIIDPYPRDIIANGLPNVTSLIQERVELTDVKQFDQLGDNDILFIDSSHTVRTGGDVNFLYLDVLPRLAKGVVVHVHDIPLPFEYPRVYYTNPAFRVFWTEAYMLQAFLALNSSFISLISMSYLMKEKSEDFRKIFKHNNPAIHHLTSSSYWIRRVK